MDNDGINVRKCFGRRRSTIVETETDEGAL